MSALDRIRSELGGPVEPVRPGGRAILVRKGEIAEVRVLGVPTGPLGLGRLVTVALGGLPLAVEISRLIAMPSLPADEEAAHG